MSEDLIKRSDAIKAIDDAFSSMPISLTKEILKIRRAIRTLPSADRPQEEWIETSEGTMCSNCHKFPYDDGEYHIANWHSDFCPHCGAKLIDKVRG